MAKRIKITDLADVRLAEIRARIEAATEGPWRAPLFDGVEYEDGSSSYRCGLYPGEKSGPPPVFLTSSIDRRDAEFIAHARADVERLVAAVEAVLALHCGIGIYDECDCEDTSGHAEIEEVGFTCNRLYEVCRECCCDDEYQREECAGYHDHRPDEEFYCPTIEAISKALAGW